MVVVAVVSTSTRFAQAGRVVCRSHPLPAKLECGWAESDSPQGLELPVSRRYPHPPLSLMFQMDVEALDIAMVIQVRDCSSTAGSGDDDG